jgi:hypothetical protein
VAPSVDVFGDGSFWPISVPGHTDDDIAYLINGTTPILLTGDASYFDWAFKNGIAPSGWNKAGTANWPVFRFANQRNPGFALDGFRFQAIGGSDSTISGGKRLNKLKTEYSQDEVPIERGFNSRTEEMASGLSRIRGAMALPKPCDRSTLSRRFDSCRPSCSDRSAVGTW